VNQLPEVADRFRVAAYWWLATEILRRNPVLELLETYPLDGFYDCLTLVGNVSSRDVHIDFNRLGSIHVLPDHNHMIEVGHVLQHQDAHWAVKEIEDAAGLQPGEHTQASNSRTITLRVLARAVNYLVNDRSTWDIRMIDPTRLGLAAPLAPELVDPETHAYPFPTVFTTEAQFHAFLMLAELPHSHVGGRLWALLRDQTPVAIFDTKGWVHTPESRVALKPLYVRMNRNLTQTMASALGGLLP
jgi:hypothetical protein